MFFQLTCCRSPGVHAQCCLVCRGDATLRSNYSTKMKQLMQEASVSADMRHVVDLGCSTGLSALELHQTFPQAQLTALDLSPYFITVAQHDQQQRQVILHKMASAALKVLSTVQLVHIPHLASIRVSPPKHAITQYSCVQQSQCCLCCVASMAIKCILCERVIGRVIIISIWERYIKPAPHVMSTSYEYKNL